MEKLVEVLDQEVRIDFALGSKCRATVTVRSLTPTVPVAFKVQTSSPHKFLVNPPSGLVPPLCSTTFQVILKPQSQLPPTFPRSPTDRFLIRTALAPELNCDSSESTHSEFIHSWFNQTAHCSIHDIKLKVAFVGPFLLQHAVMVGDCEAVRGIVKRQRSILSAFSAREAASLLRVAAQLDKSDEMLDLLLEAGLKGDATSGVDTVRCTAKGWTALHMAAAYDRTDEIEKLVRATASGSLDCRDREGKTPLFLAASRGHLGPAMVLASAGAQVDARSIDGRTALYRAVVNGDRQMVEMLIQTGADPTVSDNLGHSPIDIARDKGHEEIVKLVERGEEVLHAARRGELQLLETLLEKGAITTFCDQYGLTALHVAAIKGNKDAVMVLVDFGADLGCRDAGGHTPLHLAVQGGCAQTVEVLLNRGADVSAANHKGFTPLSIATLLDSEDIYEILHQPNAS